MSVEITPSTGDFCTLSCNTGTVASPVSVEWGEIDGADCGDLTRSSAELKVRCLNATPSLPGKIGPLTITFKYYPGFNETRYAQLTDDFFDTPTVRLWSMLDKNGHGLTMPAFVEGIPYHQPAGEAVNHDVTLKYGFMKSGDSVVEPTWA